MNNILSLFAFLAISLAVLFSSIANAAPPQTLDYQGYLADSGGVPLTGSVNVSVDLYTASVGGVAVWTQTSSPTLTNGRFSLVLDGSGGNPFPASAFDQQLYVGLTVDTDPEMTPRQPLTSVPSAFEAINSDTTDGLHANEIIAAASDEVRTPISSLPFTITNSGSYYLTQNLTATAPNGALLGQIDINTDNVTLDLMGFTLDGNGVADYGINLDARSVVEIKNGTIREFGLAGIYNSSNAGTTNVVVNVRAIANGSAGNSVSHSGIYLNGSSNRVEGCIAKDNGGSGIHLYKSSIVKDSSAVNNGGTYGIFANSGSTVTNNTAYLNQGTYGIQAGFGATIINNTVFDHQGTYGMWGASGSTLINNSAYNNQKWGIYADTGTTVIGNTSYVNNLSNTVNLGGLRIGGSSLAVNNTSNLDRQTGIYVAGTDNILRNNHATRPQLGPPNRCFYFQFSDNAAIGNTATGCTTAFDGNYPTAVDRDNDAF